MRRMIEAAAAATRGLWKLATRGQALALLGRLRQSQEIVHLNLLLAMPELAGTRRLRALARKTIASRLWNDLDFDFMTWQPYTVNGLERLQECLAAGKGVIVCSQHIGAYRRVYFELLRRGFDVALVVDDGVALTLMESTREQLRRQKAPGGEIEELLGRLTVVNAMQAGAVQHILASLDRRAVVMIYLDGNTGAVLPGGERVLNTTTVDFFNLQLAVRHGACQIAYLRQVPIVPVFASWGPGRRPAVTFLQPLVPRPAVPLAEFCHEAMRQLFALAEEELRKDPAQFEHWVYVHRWRAGLEKRATAGGAAVETARQEIRARGAAARYRVDGGRLVPMRVGRRRILVDPVGGRIIEAGAVFADVAGVLRSWLSYEGVRARLGRRHSESDVLSALAHLQVFGFLDREAAR